MSESKEQQTGDLSACDTPRQIERFFQAEIKKTPGENHFQLRQLCNVRAIEISGRCRHGHLLAIRTDKRKGNSRRYVVNGQPYHTGTWGNGPGFRWAMAGFRGWYERLLREGGLRSKQKIGTIISWACDDYLWRSLQELA